MAMVKQPLIVQVVGFQNSGKTTFVKKLLQELSKLHLRVATIKHHGHSGKPEVVEKKDSSEHIKSGAFASLVEGEGRLLLQVEKVGWNLQEKIHILSSMNPDIIVIEGHKKESYHKIVLLRNKADLEDLKRLDNVFAFVSREHINEDPSLSIRTEEETFKELLEYICNHCKDGNCKD